MISIEMLFQGIFNGFCSYLGIRIARKSHKKIKKINIKQYFKKLIKKDSK